MRLFWIRHGEMARRASVALDAATIARRLNQEEESGLSVRGRRDAEKVAAFLRAQPPLSALYASPLLRAKETGEVTARLLGLPLEVTPALTELRTGRLDPTSLGARTIEVITRLPLPPPIRRMALGSAVRPIYLRAWKDGRTIGGETPAELERRLEAFVARLETEHPADARVALFGHGYVIRTLAERIARTAPERAAVWSRPYIPNGGITTIDVRDGEWTLVRYANAAHLR